MIKTSELPSNSVQDLEKLVSLAKAVRQVCDISAEEDCLPEDLAGQCYEASGALFILAKKNGISNVELGASSCHWFVLLDNMIIDVTATQFGEFGKVVVISTEKAKEAWWKIEGRVRNLTENKASDYIINNIVKTAEEILEQKYNPQPKEWASP